MAWVIDSIIYGLQRHQIGVSKSSLNGNVISLNTVRSYEKLTLFSIAVLAAIGCMYSYKVMSFLLPLMTIIVIWFEGGIKNISFQIPAPFVLLFLLLIWGGTSIFWAENQSAALKTFLVSTLTFISALLFLSCLIQATPNLIAKAYDIIKISGLLLILLILFQVYTDTFFTGSIKTGDNIPYMLKMKPTGSILGLTAFVGCGFLWIYENKVVALFTFLILSCLILLTLCQTAFYGLVLGSTMFGLSYFMPFWMTRIGMIASYTFLIFSPAFYTHIVSSTMLAESPYFKWLINRNLFHRYLSWEYYSNKFFEKPFLGWGVESSRYLPTNLTLAPGYDHLMHPHNNSIQVYAELGLIGGILYALFFSSLFFLVGKHVKDRLSVAVCNATITFGFVGAEITHNAWRNYWLSLVALTAGLIILFLKAREAQLHGPVGHLKQSPTL